MTSAGFLIRPVADFRDSYIDALGEGFGGTNIRHPYSADEIHAIEAVF